MTEEERQAQEAAEAAAKAKAEEEAAAANKKAEEEAAAEAAKKAAEEAAAAAAKDGKPTDKEAELLKEVMKLKEGKKAAEEALKAFNGLDPEKARQALEAAAAAERKKLEDKGEYDRVIASINEENSKTIKGFEEAISGKDAEIESLKATINKLTIGNSFGNSKFINENVVLSPAQVETLYGSHFEMKDGEFVAYDKPRGAAERTPLVDSTGKGLPFETAIEKILTADPNFERMKKSKQKPGGGSGDPVEPGKEQPTNEQSGVSRIAAALAAQNKK